MTLVAILAALALPRYFSLQQMARIAKAQAVFGGVRSAAALAYAKVLVTNTVTSGPASISMEGHPVDIIHGYPTASGTGIVAALQLDSTVGRVGISGGNNNPGNTLTIDLAGGTAGKCSVFYTAPAAANQAPGASVAMTAC